MLIIQRLKIEKSSSPGKCTLMRLCCGPIPTDHSTNGSTQHHLLKWHQQSKKNTQYGVLPIGIYVDAKAFL
jgi:hypothetical protein